MKFSLQATLKWAAQCMHSKVIRLVMHNAKTLCNGNNAVVTCIEGLLGYVHLIPCFMGGELSAEHVAQLFFESVVRVFGLPDEVLHDRDPRFTADFWRHL